MPNYLFTVDFNPYRVGHLVEANSMKEAWENRYDLCADAQIAEYEIEPVHIEEYKEEE